MIIQWKWQIQGIRSDRQSAWRTMDRASWHCTGGRDQDHAQEKEIQKGKMGIWGGLTKVVNRREAKGKGERKDIPIWMQSSKE